MEKPNTKNTREQNGIRILGYAGFGLVLVLWCLNLFIAHNVLGHWQNAGVIGDAFGAVNALFSGFALVAIVLTLYLQHRQLVSQSTQIEQQAQALQQQGEALGLQRDALSIQRQDLRATQAEIKASVEQLTLAAKAHQASEAALRTQAEKLGTSAEIQGATALVNYFLQTGGKAILVDSKEIADRAQKAKVFADRIEKLIKSQD
jgi:hypothetical protein